MHGSELLFYFVVHKQQKHTAMKSLQKLISQFKIDVLQTEWFVISTLCAMHDIFSPEKVRVSHFTVESAEYGTTFTSFIDVSVELTELDKAMIKKSAAELGCRVNIYERPLDGNFVTYSKVEPK